MRMRIDKTRRDNMMMQLIMLISFVKRSYIFGFNNINDAILINNDGMILSVVLMGLTGQIHLAEIIVLTCWIWDAVMRYYSKGCLRTIVSSRSGPVDTT